MAYYDALIAKWATLSGTTDQKLAALAAITVDGPRVDVPVASIRAYFRLRLLGAAMADYVAEQADKTTETCRAARELLDTFTDPNAVPFATSNPVVFATLAGMLDLLIGAGIITTEHKADMLAMSATSQPWWQANGYSGPIGTGDLQATGLS